MRIRVVVCFVLLMLGNGTSRDGFGLSTKILVDESELRIQHVVIQSIECGSPAYYAGVYAGDTIVRINGVEVENMLLGIYINGYATLIQAGRKVVSLQLGRGTVKRETIFVKLTEAPIIEDDVCRSMVRV